MIFSLFLLISDTVITTENYPEINPKSQQDTKCPNKGKHPSHTTNVHLNIMIWYVLMRTYHCSVWKKVGCKLAWEMNGKVYDVTRDMLACGCEEFKHLWELVRSDEDLGMNIYLLIVLETDSFRGLYQVLLSTCFSHHPWARMHFKTFWSCYH